MAAVERDAQRPLGRRPEPVARRRDEADLAREHVEAPQAALAAVVQQPLDVADERGRGAELAQLHAAAGLLDAVQSADLLPQPPQREQGALAPSQ